jgi:16S rRNA (adenine1518-N6/adenine1519-N6)-dimethyltransferase
LSKVSPKKQLGQHFLKDERIAQRIADSLSHQSTGSVIEIGPGMGIVTKYLFDRAGLLTVDVDHESVDYLKQTYPDHERQFLLADFLKKNIEDLDTPVQIIGNLPYNISSQIFFKVYDNRSRVNEMVCMIQKEVADRIVSKEGNKVYGILSVLLQAYYDIEYLFTVRPGVFHPPPKVNSAVIRLKRNDTSHLDCDEVLFKKVVKSGFGKRRKTLRNALKDLNLDLNAVPSEILDQRAEQLSVSAFVTLTKYLSRE